MKKSINHLRNVAILIAFGLLLACQKEKTNDSQAGNSVEFTVNFAHKKSALKSALEYKLSDAKKIVLTIQTIDGTATQYTGAEIKIYQMNGGFYSQKIILSSGSYKLTSFVLLDSINNTIYAAPLQGSQEAQNVTIALPLSFVITTNSSNPVNVEVLSTENKTPGDFGLASFPISEKKVLNFMIAVADKESDRLLTADLSVTNGSYAHTQVLDSIAGNMVTVIDSFKTYTITIEKAGYQTYTQSYSHDTLKIFNASGNHLPLLVELEPSSKIYVDITARGNNSGLSWSDAFNSIQDGINIASVSGKTVLVAAGTYNESINLLSNVKIFGGYPNGGGVRNVATHVSTIKANGATSTVTITNGQNIEFDGFTITGGNFSGSGGGIHCYGGQHILRIANCIIEKNNAVNGGGIYLGTSSPQFFNCIIRNNTAQTNGGGAYYVAQFSYPLFVNCVFMDNQANGYGGGLYAGDYSNISNVTIYRNTANNGGSGIWSGYYYPTIANTIIWGNTTDQIITGSPTNITYSCIQGGFTGEGNVSGDPLLAADGIHLQQGSSCINTGNNAAPAIQTYDIDMNSRIINGTVDIGADETNF